MALRRRLSQGVQAAVARALLRLFAWLPLRASHAIAAGLGTAMAVIPNELRRTAATNIALCFPAADPLERRRLTRHALIETARAGVELGPLLHWPAARLLELVHETTGRSHLDQALAAGRGAILATAHLGCWELAGLYCAARTDLAIVYAPARLTPLDALITRGRGRFGSRLVAERGPGLRELYRTLAAGGTVGLLPDQDPGRHRGVFAPFFGVPAKTSTLLARLARRSGAPLVFCYAQRLPHGKGFDMHFRPGPSLKGLSVEQACVAVNRGIERLAEECPAQYQWCYRRFRTRPEGAMSLYPG
jgi:KDO2-lipid IV(A) lauroyltransferase